MPTIISLLDKFGYTVLKACPYLQSFKIQAEMKEVFSRGVAMKCKENSIYYRLAQELH
jgi:hypothetical protein